MLSKVIRFPFASRFTSWKWPARSSAQHRIAVKRYNEIEIKTHFLYLITIPVPTLPSPCPLMLAQHRGLITPPGPGARVLHYIYNPSHRRP